MKPISVIFLAILALALVGCSQTETTQDQVEKDAKAITLDPNATPDTSASEGMMPMPGPKKGGG
jgi:PBP1b-binding outer membrane lipoprotein LpoB